MWQEGTLFRGTMWENLTFGCAGQSRRRVERAVSVCGLDPLLSELPGGYDTVIAEMGATLSAGQRQRILLARALVKDAPILLLDEPTSNLDVDTEQEILQAMLSELGGKSVILVSHRPAMTDFADRVIRLAHGRLVPEQVEALAESGPQFPAIGNTTETPRIPRPWGGVQ
jgi:ABC-type bacteriocin/lantibiotic exporter with double-glycine peptidase domain